MDGINKQKNKKLQKEKHIARTKRVQQIQENIIKHHNTVACPAIENMVDVNSNSWFDIKKSDFIAHQMVINSKPNTDQIYIKCIKVVLKFTDDQQKIIISWFKACEVIYNDVIHYYKTNRFDDLPSVYSLIKLRPFMKDRITDLVTKYNIPVHILDATIKRATAHMKTCLTNLKNGTIRHFQLKYIKETHNTKILGIEQNFFSKSKNSFCTTYLGDVIDSNDFDLTSIRNTIKADCTLHYNVAKNLFTLLIPIKIEQTSTTNTRTISIDPGIRTFLLGISDDHLIEIGNNVAGKIRGYLTKINDILNNDNMPTKIKKKYREKYSTLIQNLVTDLHWKTIHYLTSNYATIIIGKWSTKNIGLKKTSVLNGMTKQIASRLRFYEFLQKLQYKCDIHKIVLLQVDESYTSKLCSKCGNENKNLGGSKTFDCNKCGISIDRDVNGSRNIFIKAVSSQ